MLSRVADSLYWMSRYLERAEHTARLLDVNLNLMLDRTPDKNRQRWLRLTEFLHGPVFTEDNVDVYQITETLTFDTTNTSSIVFCINAARENARQVREQISSEMWEQLNQLYLTIKAATIEKIWEAEPWEFFRTVKEGSHLFQGITDSTMTHGQGWEFIAIGRFIERAGSIAALVDNHFHTYQSHEFLAEDHLEWLGLLKSCTAFEAYCKVYTAELRPDRIAEFLLLNAEFPHSLRFSVDMVQDSLNKIGVDTETHKSSRVSRLAGRLQAALSFSQIDEIMGGSLHNYLDDIRLQCNQLHDVIHQTYIVYPIESALVP